VPGPDCPYLARFHYNTGVAENQRFCLMPGGNSYRYARLATTCAISAHSWLIRKVAKIVLFGDPKHHPRSSAYGTAWGPMRSMSVTVSASLCLMLATSCPNLRHSSLIGKVRKSSCLGRYRGRSAQTSKSICLSSGANLGSERRQSSLGSTLRWR
jgi:hypothetical protein